MGELRIVGRGRITRKLDELWVIDRDGTLVYIATMHMLVPAPAVGGEGYLTYEYQRSSALVNCFRALDDPLIKRAIAASNAP